MMKRSLWGSTFGRVAPAVLLAFAGGSFAACASDVASTSTADEITIECSGKCDGVSNVASQFKLPFNLDLGDLVHYGAGFATDELNHALRYEDLSAEISGPQIYALHEVAQGDRTVKDIDELVSGLTANLGEHELTTEVNRARAEHLRNSSDRFFAEAGFAINAGYSHNWNMNNIGGFDDAHASLGFLANTQIKGRVISAFGNELRSYVSPIEAARELRGFVVPRSVSDIRAMKDGELVALHGAGVLGLNFGAGVPILVAHPVSAITYNIVLSGSARTQISGELDVQLVRLTNPVTGHAEAILDVGMERGTLNAFRVAVEDGWGVSGLVKSNINIGGLSVDAGKLLDKALKSQLNRYLSLVSAEYSYTRTAGRLSVARLRFDLDAVTTESEQALAQAMRGDVRLAQALGMRDGTGVRVEFDLMRSGVSNASHASLNLLGMRFFTDYVHTQASVVVQTPGGARSLLIDSKRREGGIFAHSHGSNRIGVSALIYDVNAPVRSEANLFLQIVEDRSYFKRERISDHMDALILSTGGPSVLNAFAPIANRIETYVRRSCGLVSTNDMALRSCRFNVLTDPTVLADKAAAMQALETAMADAGVTGDRAQLLRGAAALRVAAAMTYEIGSVAGPEGRVSLDYRLGDAALATLLTTHTGEDFRGAINTYLKMANADRRLSGDSLTAEQTQIVSETRRDVDDLVNAFNDYADRYQRLLAVEQSNIRQLGGTVGSRAVIMRFPLRDNAPDYENATVNSVAQERAELASAFFDTLRSEAKQVDGPYAEQIVGYSLLSMIPREQQEVRYDVTLDLSSTFLTSNEVPRAANWTAFSGIFRGAEATTADGGFLDITRVVKDVSETNDD